MVKKILLGFTIALITFLGYVSTRNGSFHYERNGLINAPADKVFSYISNFKKGALWNPYAQKDPNMKTTFNGPDAQVGSIMEFEGNKEAGSGKLEILKLTPNQSVAIQLTMTSPFHAQNLIEYKLTPEGTGTRFSWAMSGNGGFLGKLFSVLMDCEKMVTADFVAGINNLKKVVEASG